MDYTYPTQFDAAPLLIRRISAASNLTGDKLLAFMDAYNLGGLNEATPQQLAEYIAQNGL